MKIEKLIEKLENLFEGSGYTFKCVSITKTDESYDGITVHKSGVYASPVLRLENIENLSDEQIRSYVSECISKARSMNISPENLILCALGFNQTLPENAVTETCLDTTLYLRIWFDDFGSAIVNEEILNAMDIDKNAAFEFARKNTCNSCKIEPITDVLNDIVNSVEGDKFSCDDIPENGLMFVARTKNNLYGAGILGCSQILNLFYQKKGSFYILPSSIHEFIFVPALFGIGANELREMVTDVNDTTVSANEVLNNSVYIYDGALKIACDGEQEID